MSRYTKEQFDRLPKWAQSEIEVLRADLAHARKQLVAVHSGQSDVLLQDGMGYIALPPHSSIRFQHGRNKLDVRLADGVLEIHGNDVIAVLPRAANAVWIRQEDHQ